MGKSLDIDYERMEVTASLKDGSFALIVSNGRVKKYELPDHGQLNVKIHNGKIKNIDVTASDLF